MAIIGKTQPAKTAAIEEAKKHCDYLIVALHCCPNYKKPVQTIFERLCITYSVFILIAHTKLGHYVVTYI